VGVLEKVKDYTIEKTTFGIIGSLFHNIMVLLFLFAGLLNLYNSWIVSLDLAFILSGLVFFLLIMYAENLFTSPFSLYSTFKIEKKYGFNTMTMKVWIADFIKSILISTALMAIVMSAGFWIIQKSPHLWWFWIWCFFLIFGIFMMYIAPYVIEPLFNKYTPIDDDSLEAGIRVLMDNVGIKVSRVFKMDASKRTKHTNAYFTGIGKVKRIVLYDTLLQKLQREEILAVLAHEAGHWKKKHVLKRIIVSEVIAFIAIYVSFRLMQGDLLTALFRIGENTFYAKIIVLAFVGSIVTFPFSPLMNYFSRRHERDADSFAVEKTGNAQYMIRALVKLSKDNLSNLHPHPLYAAFHYSHPPVTERIRKLSESFRGGNPWAKI
jgi:STE24 endopeptidase